MYKTTTTIDVTEEKWIRGECQTEGPVSYAYHRVDKHLVFPGVPSNLVNQTKCGRICSGLPVDSPPEDTTICEACK